MPMVLCRLRIGLFAHVHHHPYFMNALNSHVSCACREKGGNIDDFMGVLMMWFLLSSYMKNQGKSHNYFLILK